MGGQTVPDMLNANVKAEKIFIVQTGRGGGGKKREMK